MYKFQLKWYQYYKNIYYIMEGVMIELKLELDKTFKVFIVKRF